MSKLNKALIQSSMVYGEAIIFDEINSTNDYLLTHCHRLTSGSICLAESQTAGRGRRGRQWHSPNGKNLYFSMLWQYPLNEVSQISALSLIIAITIAETLEQLGVKDIQIKWPNDIYYQGKKMGGILIENRLGNNTLSLVIGIGLNLAMPKIDPTTISQPWADLSHYQFDRNHIAGLLAQRLQHTLAHYSQTLFVDYLPRWQKFDLFYKQPVTLLTEQGNISGISQGINALGELLLQQQNGQINAFAIGEISLRGMTQSKNIT